MTSPWALCYYYLNFYEFIELRVYDSFGLAVLSMRWRKCSDLVKKISFLSNHTTRSSFLPVPSWLNLPSGVAPPIEGKARTSERPLNPPLSETHGTLFCGGSKIYNRYDVLRRKTWLLLSTKKIRYRLWPNRAKLETTYQLTWMRSIFLLRSECSSSKHVEYITVWNDLNISALPGLFSPLATWTCREWVIRAGEKWKAAQRDTVRFPATYAGTSSRLRRLLTISSSLATALYLWNCACGVSSIPWRRGTRQCSEKSNLPRHPY